MNEPDLSLLAEELIDDFKESRSKSSGDDQAFHNLYQLFGQCAIEAFDLIDRKLVTELSTASGRQLFEVSISGNESIVVLKNQNFCSCKDFRKTVLEEQSHITLTCDHQRLLPFASSAILIMARGGGGGGNNLRRILCVAEKNDAAKSIAALLSRNTAQRREGISPYNKIYHFQYQFQGQLSDMMFTSVSGHLMNLDFPAQFRKWEATTTRELFQAPIVRQVPDNFRPIQRTLEREARGAHMLVIWTDCDREGENIGFEIIEQCRRVNRYLIVKRARFSEITAAAITRAVHNLVEMDARANDAVECRKELDLRIGAAFTRLQTLEIRRRFPRQIAQQQTGKQIVSYGSCQFPTLGFVVERYKQVQNFVPEPFWKLKLVHTRDAVRVEFAWRRVRLFVKEPCEILLEECQDENDALVSRVQTRPKSRWRPLPLDTVELEKRAARKLRMSARDVLNTAERLYTKGLISYPRTETNKFPDGLNLDNIVQQMTLDHRWGQFAQTILQRGCNPRQGNKSDEAHPPIHPTTYAQPNTLQGDEARVYEMVVRHFLACVSWDAQGQETTVQVEIATEQFEGTGLVITDRGFLEVYIYDQWNAKLMPPYQQGERFVPDSIEIVEGRTTAPDLLTEADLITLMDKHGIGTDATHAEHIETIKQRLYVRLRENDRRLIPGFLGLGLVDGYDRISNEMPKPNLRAELESDLKAICEGGKTKQQVLMAHLDRYEMIFTDVERRMNDLLRALGRYFDDGNNPQPVAPARPPPPPPGGDGGGAGFGPPRPPRDDGGPPGLPPRPGQGGLTDGRDNEAPLCNCGTVAPLLTVRNGPNQGKQFYGCAKGKENGCGFFAWHEQADRTQGMFPPDDTGPQCNCATPAKLCTTRSGQNEGKQFYACPKGRESGCKFFIWLETYLGSTNPSSGGSGGNPTGVNPAGAPNCRCGTAAPLCTVRSGGNQGKQFYGCAKGRENGCGFFAWLDQAPSRQ